ncbi:hypothetical protein [Reichenbachiella sp.]|uniref:hypothetical protein n=1 Tax=Reichenbachiella sp. TaxID=2184521 RepID=UPI003299AB9F
MCFRVKFLMPENRVFEINLDNFLEYRKIPQEYLTLNLMLWAVNPAERESAKAKLLIGAGTAWVMREEFKRWPCGYLK